MATESGPNGLYNSATDLMEQAYHLAEQEVKDKVDFSKYLIDYKPEPKRLEKMLGTAKKVGFSLYLRRVYTTYKSSYTCCRSTITSWTRAG